MRRSCAPSIRQTNFKSDFQSKSSENITSILRDSQHESTIKTFSKNLCKTYSVVWGKRSTKKHKTFEDDGYLEIVQNTGKLRDSNGMYLASTSIHQYNIEYGSVIPIGGYELEIGELLPENTNIISSKRSNEDVDDDESKTENFYSCKKKTANPSCFIPKLSTSLQPTQPNLNFKPKLKVENMSDNLIMSQSNYENQLKTTTREICIDDKLASLLRPHQQDGVLFLYECLLGLRNPEYNGCILADEMGLGKTLQCLVVCHTLLKQSKPYGSINKILIVTPSSLVQNWKQECEKWLNHERIYTFEFDNKKNVEHFQTARHIPFLLVSYEMLMKNFGELAKIQFDLMICDEGHRLKNFENKAVTMLNQISCKRRILLSGTPIQNNLHEFYTLMDFVNPGLLASYKEFKHKFEMPIILSQKPNASTTVRQLGLERITELSHITKPFMLRRTQQLLQEFLPTKNEFIIFCKPSVLQKQLFHHVQDYCKTNMCTKTENSAFQLITMLTKICNHPSLIQTNKNTNNLLIDTLKSNLPAWHNMGPDDSGKLSILQNLLDGLARFNDEKIVIVSYYTKTLDMIEGLVKHFNYSFCRLDGTTTQQIRHKIVNNFNNPMNKIFAFLLSAKAGGVGLNLIGASRLVLYDCNWNPASDLQVMSRIWRDGQTKNVYIYRLLTSGSIEEKIFQRQMSKTSLSGSILDAESEMESLQLTDDEMKALFMIPDDYNNCVTHELLDCNCLGDGTNIEANLFIKSKNNSDLRTNLNKNNATKALKMNKLTFWQHYKQPVDATLLRSMMISDSTEEILFVFLNQTKNLQAQETRELSNQE